MKDDEAAAPSRPVVPWKRQIRASAGFLQILQEMDETGETRGDVKGEIEGPFFSRAVYECVIRIGMDSNESNTYTHRRSVR